MIIEELNDLTVEQWKTKIQEVLAADLEIVGFGCSEIVGFPQGIAMNVMKANAPLPAGMFFHHMPYYLVRYSDDETRRAVEREVSDYVTGNHKYITVTVRL